MTFAWTPHRFSGGALALDVANSVVLRFDAARRMDRFALREQLEAFPGAAAQFCAEREAVAGLRAVTPEKTSSFLALRESIDRHFRAALTTGVSMPLLADLLEHVASTLRTGTAGELAFETAHSALRLLSETETGRMKICRNCQWLFLDRSRNRSRTWCDMDVCGNRVKARLHYRKAKSGAIPL